MSETDDNRSATDADANRTPSESDDRPATETTDNPSMTENAHTTDTMATVSHTNPYTNETAGQLFSRGPTVVADGGERGAADSNETERADESTKDTMADVEHTPPNESEDANEVFERGHEHKGEPAVADEE